MPEAGLLRQLARETSALEKRQHPELPVLRPGKEAASLLSAARGPGGVQVCWATGDTSPATRIWGPSNFLKTRKKPTTSAGPRDARAQTGKGRTGQEKLEGPVPQGK